MRRAQLLRRRRLSGFLFFTAITWVGVGMGFDMRSGLITGDFRLFLEKKLNSALVGKEVRLAKIEGGIFQKLAIQELSVSRRAQNGNSVSSPIFSVDKILIKYNLLNLLRKRFEKFGDIYLVSPVLFFDTSPRETLVSSAVQNQKPLRFHILNGSICGFGRKQIFSNLDGVVGVKENRLIFNDLKGSFLNLPVQIKGRIENFLETPTIKLRLLIEERYYNLRVAFISTGGGQEGSVYGSIRLFDRFNLPFKGRINIASDGAIEIKELLLGNSFYINGEINLYSKSSRFIIRRGDGGFIKVISDVSQEKGLYIYAKVNHLNMLGFDVLSQININANLYKIPDSPVILKGRFKTQNLILNYRPFYEIRGSWIFKKDKLFITGLELGDKYRLHGSIKLKAPYDADLTCAVNNALLEDWLILSRYSKPGAVSGIMNGNLNIKGPIKTAVTKGKFEVRDGNIKDIKFDSINLNLDGKGPIVKVCDSKIFKEGGFLFVDGEIDFRKFGKRNLLEDINIKTDQRVIVWEGWDITKDIDTSEVRLRKDVSEDFKVNFRSYISDDYADQEKRKSEIGVDYKIKKDDSINLRMEEDRAFVGVEHKVKF